MKISVLGNIIDTEHIYAITSITKLKFNRDTEMGGYYTTTGPDFRVLEFDIILFDGIKRNIRKGISFDATELDREEALRAITTLRDVVIGYWSNNQSNIPKIEFI